MNDLILPSLPEMTDIWLQTLNWQPTPQQQEQFQRFYQLILEGNRQLNLTRITEPQEFWEKHLWDSLRAITPRLKDGGDGGDKGDKEEGGDKEASRLSPVSSSTSSAVIDIGTGAGIPGIPAAIAVTNFTVSLLDATRKKVTFLEKILAELNLNNVKTITGRAEEIGRQPQHRQTYDIALVRAVGTATVCAEYALPLLKQDGLALLYRGNWTEEEKISLDNAVKELGGVIDSIEKFTTPLTHSIRHCVYLRKVATTPANFPRAVGIPTQKPL